MQVSIPLAKQLQIGHQNEPANDSQLMQAVPFRIIRVKTTRNKICPPVNRRERVRFPQNVEHCSTFKNGPERTAVRRNQLLRSATVRRAAPVGAFS